MRFLLGVATLAVVATLAGCGGDTSDEATTAVSPTVAPGSSKSADAVDQRGDTRSSASGSKPSGEGSKDERARSETAKSGAAGKANGESGKSRSAQKPVDQVPDNPDVPDSLAEVRKQLEEVEARNQRLLNPPPGKTTQEVVEEIQEELQPNP